MGIIDSNARWADEDKAMAAILDGTDAVPEWTAEEIAADKQAWDQEMQAQAAEEKAMNRESANIRKALGLPDDHPISLELADGFKQLTSNTDTMREAMLGYKELGNYPAVVAAVFCAMGAEVRDRIFGYTASADCFCRINRPEVRPEDMGFWQYDPKVVRFIYDAVKEKIAREEMPETLTHTSTAAGQRLTVTLRRVGAKDYEVDEVTLGALEPF